MNFERLTRRDALGRLSRTALAGWTAASAAGCGSESSDEAAALELLTVGFTLGIHVPAIAAWSEMTGGASETARVKLARLDKLPVITQSILAGSGDVGDGDIVSTLRAVEAGADLKIVGLPSNSSSLVFVANSERVRTLADLARPDVVVAVNSLGDFTHVLLVGPLREAGVDPAKLTIVEIGGSGDRLRALLAGKVQAVPVHVDQAAEVLSQGKFRILIEPWKVYPRFFGEVLFVRAGWLEDDEHRRSAVDVLKATLRAFRRANADYDWFAANYAAHATRTAAVADDVLRPLWETLRDKVRAWPAEMEPLTAEAVAELIPIYRQAGAVAGTFDPERVVERSLLEQALQELPADA